MLTDFSHMNNFCDLNAFKTSQAYENLKRKKLKEKYSYL